ncbi:hypothetical protein BJ912DRAFT_1139660 [Pholiota molesta]|nr:hypothetical protein BJ912DRAFT_1139660 [Pholiota molesta]
MPLPDERPRQSVANLIGKFETQTKRLSLSASSPSRSSSVVSHITGDSTKEEVKEKREWPPKSVAEQVSKHAPVVPSLYSRHIPPPLIAPSASNPSAATGDDKNASEPGVELEVPLTAKALNASLRQVKPEPNSFLENWRNDIPPVQADIEPEPVPGTAKPDPAPEEPDQATPTLAPAKKMPTPSTPRTPSGSKTMGARPPASAVKTVTSTPARTPAKSTLRSPASKQSLASPAIQPLKPQHTGQSVASSATTKRTVTKPPPTPSSAKLPRPDAASRSKTPTLSRPKTPSTGLFAPTAASLAKSRNAPPVPTPVKKAHLSSSSMDRLSKPTAASQARMTAAAATSRTAAAAPRASTAAKATVPPSPKATKKAPATSRAATGAAVAASVTTIGTVAAVLSDDEAVAPVEALKEVAEHSENGHVAQTSEAAADSVHAPDEVEVGGDEEVQENITSEENDTTPMSPSPAPVLETDVVIAETEETSPVEEAAALEVEEAPVNDHTVTIAKQSRDELEDIINLLESTSITKLTSDTTDIPDEILEIPDEDEK